MSTESILCRRCGAANSAGDQFCGSCGAFLEWEGEALELDGTAAPEAVAPADLAPRIGDGVPHPAPAPAAPASVPSEQPDGFPPAAGVACRACGRPNPPGRTFCQACGTRLAPGSTTSLPPVVPAGQPTAGPPGQAPARPRESQREAGAFRASGGLPGWLPVVVVLGLLAGVGGVAAAALLRPPDVPSGASSEPGTPPATLTPTLPPASPVDSVAATGSPVPPDSVALTMTGATASSVVGNREMFAASMVIDGELTTCWQEGAPEEAGEWIEVTFEASRLDYVVVYSGYQLSHDAYLANRRPKDVSVSVDGGPAQAFVLADTEVPQRIAVGGLPGATRVRITIVSTYDPEATAYPGGPFDDLAISEIRAFGVPGG